ncbi:MAG: ornithine cyclodeaminase family protein [Pseudomonadota bacterium]
MFKLNPGDLLLYLSRAALETLDIATADVVARIDKLFKGCAAGSVWNASKRGIALGDGRYVMNTLSLADNPPYAAVKALGLNPANKTRGFDSIGGLVVVLDSVSGRPLAIMDGNWLTAIRTAGLSAVAATYLAKDDASTMAFIGCGIQARSHLDAFADLYPLREVRAFGRGAANRDRLCALARDKGIEAIASASAQEAVDGADIIVSAVSAGPSLEPFLDAGWLSAGAFAAITDLHGPWRAETFPAFDRIIIDDLEQDRVAARRLIDPGLVTGDFTGLVCGDVPVRRNRKERIAFAFRGLALGDLALASLAYEAALKAGVGLELDR